MSERILEQFEEFELPPLERERELTAPQCRAGKRWHEAVIRAGQKSSRGFRSRQRYSLARRKPKITLATKA